MAKALWAVWPAWVWFAVMATGNHFWLDCLAGIGVAILAMPSSTAGVSAACLPLVGRNRPPADANESLGTQGGTVRP